MQRWRMFPSNRTSSHISGPQDHHSGVRTERLYGFSQQLEQSVLLTSLAYANKDSQLTDIVQASPRILQKPKFLYRVLVLLVWCWCCTAMTLPWFVVSFLAWPSPGRLDQSRLLESPLQTLFQWYNLTQDGLIESLSEERRG